MTRFKDFGKGVGTDKGVEPLSFKLHGKTFKCVPRIQGKLLLDYVAASGEDNATVTAKNILSFFDHVLDDKSLVTFNALIESKTEIVEVEDLAEITGWLIEEYTNRPEKQPEVS